jgi:Fis family transcriptional regulator, factor for inversion stimulation protein
MKKENEISACVRKTVSDYFKHLDGEKPCAVYEAVLESMEKPLIEVVLNQAGGNQTKAADILGLNRNTLRKKMSQYGID